MKKEKVLLVIDMQNDFVTGALANKQACDIIGNLQQKITACKDEGTSVFFTRDTHEEDYLHTQEGRLLPVPHCIKGTQGWQIIGELQQYACEDNTFDKPAFGSLSIGEWLTQKLGGEPEEIELCGVCTDICVISNAMILKAAFPESKVTVDGMCCAGVTPESHMTALLAMKACQIFVK